MVEILNPGMMSSIQDIGRYGYRKFGVPVSGAMDHTSMIRANRLVGNKGHEPVIETTLHGLIMCFHVSNTIAVTGADVELLINGNPRKQNTRINIEAGDVLEIKKCKQGLFSYVAVYKGFLSEKVLKSHSYYEGITPLNQLKKKQKINISSVNAWDKNHAALSPKTQNGTESKIFAYKGPDWDHLKKEVAFVLKNKVFTVGKDSNRMAFQLNCEQRISAEEITTAPVQPGTVQITPSGQTSVLMRDAQTTGGYCRALQLSDQSIDHLSQLRPGSKIRFKIIDQSI